MLDDEVAEIVTDQRALGSDDADVEAKRATDKLPRSTREMLSAFANTPGGVLIHRASNPGRRSGQAVTVSTAVVRLTATEPESAA